MAIIEVPTASRRSLVLVTKVLQQLANGQEFAGKEAYMKPMNPFIQNNIPRLSEFFTRLVVRYILIPVMILMAFRMLI